MNRRRNPNNLVLGTKGKGKQFVRMIVAHQELKSTSEGLSTTISNTGTVTSYTTFAPGLQAYARVGDQIEIKAIEVKYKITAPIGGLLTAADAYDTVRVIFFRWFADDTADVPGLSSILVVPINAAHSDATVYNYNRDKIEKFKILYDKTIVVYNAPIWDGSAARIEPGPGHVFASKSITFNSGQIGDPHIDYVAGANTGWGNIYSLVVSDSAFSPHPAFVCSVQTDFTDS